MAGAASPPDDLDQVVAGELALLDPAVRSDPARLADLLHPDFTEIGRSGRLWDREAILARLVEDPAVSGRPSDLDPVRLAPGVVLLTYRSADGTRRSSLWLADQDERWRCRFHQGTPA